MADTTHKLPDGFVIPLPGAVDLPSALAGSSRGAGATEVRRTLVVPGYEIRRELARGGMGVVLEAWSQRLGRLVALKLLVEPLDPELSTRLRREAEAAARLQHPNVVGVLEAGEVAGCPFIAMELVQGRTLEALVQAEGPLEAPAAARLVRQLADALAQAHARGVLHRDLKPANVLVEPDGRPRLVDFGLAQLSDELARLTQTGAILGTPAYMSPEQALGEKERIGPQTDVYSLGAVLYHALSGTAPFVAKSAIGTIEAVARRRPVPLEQVRRDVDPELALICLRCLEKAPEQRWPGAEALRDALLAWEERWRPGLRRSRGPGRRAIALAAAALGLGGLLAAGLLVRRSSAPAEAAQAAVSTAVAARPDPAASGDELGRLLAVSSEATLEEALVLSERPGFDRGGLDPARVAALELARCLRARRHDLRAGDLDALRNAPPPWADLARVDDLLATGRFQEAHGLAERLQTTLPRLAWVKFALARSLLQLQRLDDAARAADEALALAPDDPVLHYWLAMNLAERADPAALGQFERVLGLAAEGSPLQLDALESRAQLLLKEKQLDRAEADLSRVLEREPRRVIAMLLRAQVHHAAGNAASARADLARARELGPSSAQELRLMGVLVGTLDGPLAGLEWFDKAIAAGPDLAEAHLDRSSALAELHWIDEALAAARRSADLAPGFSPPLRALAAIHHLQGKKPEALAAARKALRCEPGSAELQRLVAGLERNAQAVAAWFSADERRMLCIELEARHRAGRSAELLGALDRMLAERPGDVFFRLVRAAYRVRAGDEKGASEDAAWGKTGMDTLEKAELGRTLVEQGFVEPGKAVLLSALLDLPGDVECRRALVAAHLRAGEWTQAELEAGRLLTGLPSGHAYEVDARWALASCYSQREQHQKALDEVKRVQELARRGVPMGIPAEELERTRAALEELLGRR